MEALFLFRSRRYEESVELCTEILKETPLDKVNYFEILLLTSFLLFLIFIFYYFYFIKKN